MGIQSDSDPPPPLKTVKEMKICGNSVWFWPPYHPLPLPPPHTHIPFIKCEMEVFKIGFIVAMKKLL